jgi:protein-tyrosine phosphatase
MNPLCITAVVNVALEPDDPVEGIINLHVPMEDGVIPMMAFDRALTAIEEHIQSGRVLVHCVMGVSRSVTVVALHLAMTERLALIEALKLVKELRIQADPTPETVESAMRYLSQRYQRRKPHGRL